MKSGVAPTLGRVIIYTSLGSADGKYPPEPHPALITGLNEDGTVSLVIFYRTGIFNMGAVPYALEPERGCWSWPRIPGREP